MAKSFKIKHSDNARNISLETKRRNRLNSIKDGLETGKTNSFEQIFAIMSESRIAIELGISYHTLHKKILDPGEFTINEMMRLAALFGVKYDIIANFIRDRINGKFKSRIFRD